MKKHSVATAGALALATAAVLVVRNWPNSDPQMGAAASSKAAAQAAPIQPGDAARSAATAGDPDIFNKIVQRHDEQVRARGGQDAVAARAAWDKMKAAFDDSMKEEPGVKKFGAARQVYSIGPGESVIMGGWSPKAGQRTLVFITPTLVDSAGNRAAPRFGEQAQITLDVKFSSGPEQAFVKAGLQALLTEQSDSKTVMKCSDSELWSFINAIGQSAGADMMSAPRVTTLLGRRAQVAVQNTEMIAGKNQALGVSFDSLPTLSADGVSVDLGAIAQQTESAADAGQ